jgi:ADP-ribose pyrophosphatase
MTAHGRGDPPPTGPIPPPEVVSRSTLYKGKKFAFDVLSVRRPIPPRPSSPPAGGSVTFGRPFEWAMIRHPGAVVVVPILPDGRVVLIRNYRLSVPGELIECCAGTIEPPEPPEVCAARELEEETGFRAARLVALGWFYTTPGMTDERMHAFAATGLTHVGQRLEEDETIDVLTVDAPEALAMATDGRIRDAKSMLALHAAARAGLLT